MSSRDTAAKAACIRPDYIRLRPAERESPNKLASDVRVADHKGRTGVVMHGLFRNPPYSVPASSRCRQPQSFCNHVSG